MATTYTTLLKLAKPTQGELDGSWGTVVNDNITSMVEEAIAGRSVINTWSGNSATLSTADGTTAESRSAMLSLTDTGTNLSGAATVICPTLSKIYIVKNGAGQAATLKTSGGTGIAVPNGKTMILFCDGTNVEEAINNFTGALTTTAITASGTVTVGVDDTGYDVKFFGATSGAYMLWDESADDLKLVGAAGLTVAGDVDVDGTTNLDAVDIDGAVQLDSTLTVGVNDTGYDVKLFGATSGAYLLWDESADDLKLVGAAGMTVAGDVDVDGTTNLDAVDIDGATQIDGTVTVGVDDTGYDVKFFGATSGAYMLWDESADDLKLVGAAGLTVAGDIDVDGTTNLDAVDVDGAVNFAADVTFADGADIITASAGTSNFRAGVNAGNSIASGGNYNVCVGDEAGTALTTGTDNVLIGYGAGDGFDAEDYNVGIGTNALGGASYAAAANTAVGYQTGLAITSGTANVAVGAYCLDANTSASGNTAVGYGALSSTQTGAQTTAVGYLALNQALEDNNTAVGYGAMQGCTAGENNVAVGHAALDATLIADFNVAVGVNALSTATEGHTNTAVGYSAGRDINTGTLNTAVGGWAGVQMTTCTSNVLVGNNAGYALTSGSSNVAVGHNALYTAVTSGNQIAIGYGALQVANNTSNSNVAIGHTTGDAITDAIGNVLCGYAAGSAINTGGYNVMIGYNAGMGSNAITTGVSNIFIGNGSAPEAVGDNYEMVIAAGVNNVGKGGSTGYITAAGGAMYNGQNSTVWVVDSDRRIKKDIVPNTKGLAAIIQIEPKNFYYKSTEELQEELPGAEDKFPLNELKTSAIAQELEPIFPEAILRRGEHDIMSVDTDPIFWSMINAIKELSAEIDELKKWKEEHTGG